MAEAGTYSFRFKADVTDFAAKVGGMVANLRDKLNTGIQGLVKNQLLQYFTLSGIINQFKQLVSYADRYYDISKKLGVDTTFLQELGYVMEQTGSDIGMATFAVKELKVSLSRLGKGDVAAIEALGLSAEKLRQMKIGDAFREIVNAAGKLSEASRADVLSNLFGRGFLAIAPIVGEEWKTITGEFQRLNLAIDELDVKKLSDFADQMDRLRTMKFKAGAAVAGPGLAILEGLRAEFAMFESVLRSLAMFFMPKGGLGLRARGKVAGEPMRELWQEWKNLGLEEANRENAGSLIPAEMLARMFGNRALTNTWQPGLGGAPGMQWMSMAGTIMDTMRMMQGFQSPQKRPEFNIEPTADAYSRMGLFLTPGIAANQNTIANVLKEQLQEFKRARKELEAMNKNVEKAF